MTMKLTLSSAHRCDTRELRAIRDRLDGLTLRVDSPLKQLTTRRLNHALFHAHALLHTLPSHLDEVMQRTESTSLFELRVALFCLIDSDQLNALEADQLAPLFRVIGVKELTDPLALWIEAELKAWHRAPTFAHTTRVERGLASVFHSERGHELFEALSEHERIELSGPWVRPMLRLAPREVFPRQALLALYRSTSALARPELIHQLELCRRQINASALPAYELLLHDLSELELELLFSYLASRDELSQIKPLLERLPEQCRRAFEYIRGMVSEVC